MDYYLLSFSHYTRVIVFKHQDIDHVTFFLERKHANCLYIYEKYKLYICVYMYIYIHKKFHFSHFRSRETVT